MTTSRLAAAAAAPVLTLALLAGVPAHADAPQVDTSDFLTGAQVGKVFGDLKKSKLDTGSVGFTVYTANCTKQKTLKVKADMYATYATARSRHMVQVSVQQLRSTSAAKKVLKGARTEIRCGFVNVDDGAHFTRTRAPKVGSEAVGQLIRWDGEQDEPARIAHYVFRKKNRVVTVLVAGEKAPNLAKARKLAKKAYKVGL